MNPLNRVNDADRRTAAGRKPQHDGLPLRSFVTGSRLTDRSRAFLRYEPLLENRSGRRFERERRGCRRRRVEATTDRFQVNGLIGAQGRDRQRDFGVSRAFLS